MIDSLCKAGAQVSLYQNDAPISLEFLDNWLDSYDEIDRQVQEGRD